MLCHAIMACGWAPTCSEHLILRWLCSCSPCGRACTLPQPSSHAASHGRALTACQRRCHHRAPRPSPLQLLLLLLRCLMKQRCGPERR